MSMVHSGASAYIPGELVARLEAASEGSRALDVSLAMETTHPYGFDSEREIDAYPHPTTSIDDALALAKHLDLAPFTGPISLTIAGSGQAYIAHIDPCGEGVQAFGRTPALALCIAILKAATANSVGMSEANAPIPPVKTGEG